MHRLFQGEQCIFGIPVLYSSTHIPTELMFAGGMLHIKLSLSPKHKALPLCVLPSRPKICDSIICFEGRPIFFC